MELLNKLTMKNLKLNKKRTIVTIIGIVLSVALITAVASLFFSARSSLIRFETKEKGNFHYCFFDVPVQNINEFKENRKIETMYLVQSLGYDYLQGSKNEYKPYVYVKAFDKDALENLAINLLEGRLPENENEILAPSHTKTNGGVTLNVGEIINLNLGTRVSAGEELNQNNPYVPEQNEEIINTASHTYTIVGIIERPSSEIEDYSAPGYTFVTYMDQENLSDKNVDVFVRYTKEGIKDYLKVSANILGVDEEAYEKLCGDEFLEKDEMEELTKKLGEPKYETDLNSYLILLESGIVGDSALKALGTAVIVVVIIIIFTSVFCIKNSFDISITEKTKQYGMLSSIGATRKQIKKNVYYEALILGLIGTPIGILVGEIASYILIMVSNYFLKDALNVELVFSFSWIAIVFAIILSFVTIYLSARRSAKRASKITPITAIRNSENIKIKSKKIKSPKIINKIFGIGGEISYKNLKRSKKKYRTTVISIIVCVSVFIALSLFINLAFNVIKVEFQNQDYNIHISYRTNEDIDEKMKEIYNLDSIKNYSAISSRGLNFTTDKYSKEYLKIHPDGGNGTYTDEDGVEHTMDDYISVYSVNTEEFTRYVKSLGLKYEDVKDKGILINNIYETKKVNDKYIEVEIPKYTFKVGDTIKGYIDDYKNNTKKDCSIKIAKITTEVPMGMNKYSSGTACIFIDEKLGENIISDSYYKNVYIDSKDASKTQEEIIDILRGTEYNLVNEGEIAKMMNSFYTLIAIFLYGFITVIALIGVTNIFNTITTNMNLRRREFAMLKSIGMTKKEFNRMIRLESFFYGMKSLIIGIPIGCVLSYLIYKALMSGELIIKYHLPISAIIISAIAVFLLITTIMKYSINKINKQNIIETIRNDNI
ncbi:MAG: ABC transporter permease [Clostridia bacterium]|nr:ABC transporter permease [Clostridia bacterium]